MPPKKVVKPKEKKPQADPDIDLTGIPPPLPPSVEEAYRRKCIQLKQRINEVEEENDATRLRLARRKRQIEKARVERAFLLEQLSRRTSTNVEDSEGSPSPPPTPKEKPLRTKRGHRKTSLLPSADDAAKAGDASPFISQNLATLSPTSETFSQTVADSSAAPASRRATNGLPKAPKQPPSAFEMYCEEARPAMLKKRDEKDENEKGGEAELSVDEELARNWDDLPESEKKPFETRHDEAMAQYKKDKEAHDAAKKKTKKAPAPAQEEKDEHEGDAEAERASDGGNNDKKDVKSPAAAPEETMKDVEDDVKTGEGPDAAADKAKSGSAADDNATPAAQDEDVEMTMDDNDGEGEGEGEGETKDKPSGENEEE
ncbi:hypothetical protein SODALDRAFT_97585 [Sodiomyces alkalinus F11]|uniref:HMG box domain-containing protein n=1 Tax=Sodiomyces alkalinus (strain CBS 110278 / VKM F-3762 / F11) TaxID=1314773 RepID=A0A3N2Q166_SODAK|nr:hypothetical protein SODALDRAFT_97585 [Sodiomyces alkalinus F11]ROT40504.1 hypothetical protein SODALDRAFT_97585 [Sodiomyces alkalinus F11]